MNKPRTSAASAHYALTILGILVLLTSSMVLGFIGTGDRYMRSGTATVNGLNAYILNTTQSSSYVSLLLELGVVSNYHPYMGIRVWARNSIGSETEITNGSAIAIAVALSSGLKSATWSCPEKSLDSTDSIIVRVYHAVTSTQQTPVYLIATFSTEQLSASYLNASTWTVYYYVYRVLSEGKGSKAYFYDWYFQFGDSSHNSRVSGMVLTEAVSTRTWHYLTWIFDLVTRQWSYQTRTFDLVTRQWNYQTRVFELVTRQWNYLYWIFDLVTRSSHYQYRTFDLVTRQWNYQTWVFDLITRQWNYEYLTFDLTTRAWSFVSWMFELTQRTWNFQYRTFDLPTREWSFLSWSFELGGRFWNFQVWSFELMKGGGFSIAVWVALSMVGFVGLVYLVRRRKTQDVKGK